MATDRPERQEPADYHARMYEHYSTTHMTPEGPLTRRELLRSATRLSAQIGRFLPPDRGAAILDVGCGAGEVVWFMQHRGYLKAIGIDLSAEQVALARSLGLEGVEQADAGEYLGSHPDEFDLITVFDVLEHIPKNEVLGFLDALRGALKTGGRMIIHTANGESPFGGRYLYGDFTHETAYTGRSIRQLSRVVGFREISVSEVQPVPHGALSAIRFVLWKVLRSLLVGFLVVETGVLRGHILSQNLLAVARK